MRKPAPREVPRSMRDIYCIAPRRKPSYPGERCGQFVTRSPYGSIFHLVGLVGHSSLAAREHLVFACTRCAFLHEVRAEAVWIALDEAA